MFKKNSFITGTLLLTAAGFLSRFIGFFYRAFLSRTFGAEGMGIYQLLAPVMALSYSLTAAGIQTAISKYTAAETTTHNYRHSQKIIFSGFLLSVPLSFFCTWYIFHYADWIAAHFLLEIRCAPLLRLFALSIPFCSIHSIINGYFYGIKRSSVPALTQILEQLARVGSVYLLCSFMTMQGKTPSIACAVAGLTIGEGFSSLISIADAYLRFAKLNALPEKPLAVCQEKLRSHMAQKKFPAVCKQILAMSIPLTASRIIVNILQSIEAVFIPQKLITYGFTSSQALSVYGVLTGMALPLVLFPGALINSACVLLLPVISEAEETGKHERIVRAIKKSTYYCTLFGFICTAFFLIFGNFAGNVLFKSNMAGSFIMTLSFICPLLYLSGAYSSILHGLGKTGLTLLFNVLSLLLRLFFVYYFIPAMGIRGYLYGLLFSQLVLTALNLLAVYYATPLFKQKN